MFLSFSVYKVTNGTYNFVSLILNVAFVAATFTAGFPFETFAALSSVAAIVSLLVLLNITQFVDQFKISSISQLIDGVFSDLQKLLKRG